VKAREARLRSDGCAPVDRPSEHEGDWSRPCTDRAATLTTAGRSVKSAAAPFGRANIS
jgi:hypothetical protein